MGKSFTEQHGRSYAGASATRLSVEEAGDLLARLGTSVEEVKATVGLVKRGKRAGAVNGSVWIVDVKEGGWSRPYVLGDREYGSTGVVRPGRRYVIAKGWFDAVIGAHDGNSWCDAFGSTWGGPAAKAIAPRCNYGFLGGSCEPIAAAKAFMRNERDVACAIATIDDSIGVLSEVGAALAGVGKLVWNPGGPDDAGWLEWEAAEQHPVGSDAWNAGRAELAGYLAKYPRMAETLAEHNAKVATARRALVKWSGFAA